MSKASDAYALVIEDLKRQRDEIDRMIVRLEALAAGKPAPVTPEGESGAGKRGDQKEEDDENNPSETEGEFLGMTVSDAARIVLGRRRKPMRPSDITADLERGGLILSNPNTVASVLHRRSRDVGDFVSPKRGVWGLKEWYPGRNFGKTEGSEKVSPTEPSEPEQPSEQPRIVPLRSNGEP